MAGSSVLTATQARLPTATARYTACQTWHCGKPNSSDINVVWRKSATGRGGARGSVCGFNAHTGDSPTRKNWQHHVSRRIAAKAQTVVIEKLNTRGMTKSAKGTTDEPGTNVRQKAGLNRVILHTGWAALGQMLNYKAAEVIEVSAAYTSQTCSTCGVIDADSRRSQSEFKCVACGHAQNADLNAARNIRASGTGATARRGVWAANLYDP